MGRRLYKRLNIELPVTISGVDNNGNRFTQTATTVEISARGLRMRGISCMRGQRGELVHVKYQDKTARYRVAWIGQDGNSPQQLLGLEAIDDAALMVFADHLPFDFAFASDPRADAYAVPGEVFATTSAELAERCKPDRRQVERRRYPRYPCVGNARIWEQGQEIALNARVNELANGGCYFEMMSPLRLDTCLRLELSVNGATMHLEAVVRYSQPNFGMGVEFTKIPPAEAEKLHRVIAEISGAVPKQAPEPPPPPPVKVSDSELEDAVARWFGLHDTLTRQEYQGLKKEVAHAEQGVAR